MTFFRFPLKIIVAVNGLVLYRVKSFISKPGRAPAMESKRMKSTLLIISNRSFLPREDLPDCRRL